MPITLLSNASGSGTFTIVNPASNTSRVIVLPDASGTLLTSVIAGTPTEQVFTITGTSAVLEPDNGSIQIQTLTANTTYTDGFSAGQAITLMIDDGTASTVTWPTMTWVNNARAAPTLATTGYTVISLWKVGSTLYGALVGNGS